MSLLATTVIVLTYIDTITHWWPPEKIAENILVPGYAPQNLYNYVALSFWTTKGPTDIALLWANPLKYFGAESSFGKTNQQIQLNLIEKYHKAGMKVIVSAFGSSEQPTTHKTDPIATAQNLANFVLKNHLDGCDIDWQDSNALKDGSGYPWLVTFTKKLRELLPGKIITHAPQGPYFNQNLYPKGGYTKLHQTVGNLISFYNIQFYNQDGTTYDSYETLCIKSNGWSLLTAASELSSKWGIPKQKIVIGKPAAKEYAYNTGYVNPDSLGGWLRDYYKNSGWKTGVMFWQFRTGSGNDDGIRVAERAVRPLLNVLTDIQENPNLLKEQ